MAEGGRAMGDGLWRARGAPARRTAAVRRARTPVVPTCQLEARVATLLRRSPTALVPLEELSRALTAELGAEAGEARMLRERLVARPDLFMVLEHAAPVIGAEEWSAAERAAYEAALRKAGWEPGALIGAVPTASAPGSAPTTPEAHVAAGLAELAAAAARDESLRDRVSEALPLAEATMRVLAEAFRRRARGSG